MKFLTKNAFAVALLGGMFALGCSSSTNGDDGGGLGGAGGGTEDAGTDAPTLFGLSAGDSCFDIVSVATGSNDGCMIGVADLVGVGILINYNASTGVLTAGTAGTLGAGAIAFNQGTLTRDSPATDPQMTTCTWHQTDTGNVTVTATNEFDIAVTEVENMFANACSAKPTGGTCTSTWTWHMKKGTKSPPGCN
jgi:hypothetical protein